MELLKPPSGWPAILLGRIADAERAADLATAEEAGAWGAWRRVIDGLTPEALTAAVSASKLRGRGGAGHLTAAKWRACAAAPGPERYVVANGFEADPGAQTDRTLLERDPHAVLEGIALAAYAVGATRAIVAVNARHATAIERLRAALDAAIDAGLVGESALGSSVRLAIEIRALSGSMVTGEETVLLRALEDRRAQPDQRPPWPAERGLWGRPTVVHNVQTLAALPWIVTQGAEAFAAIGAPDAPGTVLVQVSGAVRKPGIVEAPLGTPVAELIKAAGGARGTLKAVLVGGPTGGFLPPDALDTGFAFEPLRAAGALVGSGSVLAVDASTSIVELATMLTRFLSDEACGKTIPCRIGTRRLAELGDGLCQGLSRPTDLRLIGDLAADVRDGALCGLEAGAVNPLLSGMRYFADEFTAAAAPRAARPATAARTGSHA